MPTAAAGVVPEWADGLPEFDVDDLTAFYPEAAEQRDARVSLVEERVLSRTSERRRMIHALHVANAARTLDRLPVPGESFHIAMAGNFAGWDFVPAILRLIAPATIRQLDVATLGFNRQNLVELFQLMAAGTIAGCSFLASVYYRSTDPDVWQALVDGLAARGGRALAMRNHAKILLIETTDGRHFVNESSANLRSCRNVEQATLTHDRELLTFHRGWIDEMFQQSHR